MKYRKPKAIAKKESQKQFWRIFLIEGTLFLLTSLLAIFGAFELNRLVQAKQVYLPATSLQDFLVNFLIVTFVALLFVSFKNKKVSKFKGIIYKGFFVITCFFGGMTLLDLFLPVFGSILIMGVLIIWWLQKPKVWVHNVLIILGLAGSASFLGLEFSPAVVVAILLIFSVYDFIAVYKTKHMVALAKEMIDKKVIVGFVIPKEIKHLNDNLGDVKPGGNFMILGGGDIVFPSLLAVSVIPQGFLKALVIVLFSLAGSFFSYWIFTREKEPIPALPPIALFAIVGYLITLFL